MRSDISKVLVTTARYGSRLKNEEVQALRRERIDEDYDGPSRVTMRPGRAAGHWSERKQLNEYLNPLYRFLERRVGDRWDDVYSEICHHNRRGSAVGEHIFQHLRDYVRVKTTDVSRWWSPDFYVDDTGVLRRSPPRPPWNGDRPLPRSWRSTDDDLVWYVRRDDGCWFEWTLHRLNEVEYARYPLCDRKPSGFRYGLPSRGCHYGLLRTLSRREKCSLGLV